MLVVSLSLLLQLCRPLVHRLVGSEEEMAVTLRILCLFAALSLALCDVYLHNPRGSNNRLNERSANRNNANRMFNSQVSSVGAIISAPK